MVGDGEAMRFVPDVVETRGARYGNGSVFVPFKK